MKCKNEWGRNSLPKICLFSSPTPPFSEFLRFLSYVITPSMRNVALRVKRKPYISWILANTSQVDSGFCSIWLVPLFRNIQHYSPPSKTRWHSVLFNLGKKNFCNKWSCRARQYQKINEIWQLSIWIYKLLLLLSDKWAQDVFRNVLFTNDEWEQADLPSHCFKN